MNTSRPEVIEELARCLFATVERGAQRHRWADVSETIRISYRVSARGILRRLVDVQRETKRAEVVARLLAPGRRTA